MKIALVTTAYLDNPEYKAKTIKFVEYYSNYFENIHIIDNGSDKFHYIHGADITTQYPFLPRAGHLDYPYLWRATYSLKHFFEMGYDKVIYMDNDFYMLSNEIIDWAKNKATGFTSLWCKKHNFPETGIQIVTKDASQYLNFVADGKFCTHNGKTMETTLPVSIETSFNGDRWCEYNLDRIPKEADYIAQTPLEWPVFKKD